MNLPSANPKESWQKIVARYQQSDKTRAWIQVANSFLPFFALWGLMYWSLGVSYFITLPLAILSAGFLVRIFIICHDCGHGSFFSSQRWNDVIGFFAGILTFIPYFYWRHTHAIHHATAGNLDKRGIGDVWTMTVQEYKDASRWERIRFRVYRNPFIMLVVGAIFMFLISHRFAAKNHARRWHFSVMWANLAMLAWALFLISWMGLKAYLVIQLPVIIIAGAGGIFLFYVQHQFEDVYWARMKDWDYFEVAIRGSSYFNLPRLLQWFSGNIGFHHIHHLSPKIPNYFLDKCHRENPIFHRARCLKLWDSIKCLRLRLWDESSGRLVEHGSVFF